MYSVLFAGSDPISMPTLFSLHSRGWIGAVLSVPPRKKGRGHIKKYTPVAQFAQNHRIPLFHYDTLNEQAYQDIAQTGCTILVCVAFGLYFNARFLSLFAHGTFNLHPSLLPRFRGASPIVSTILSGDKWAGVSIIEIAKTMDGGDIFAQKRIACTAYTTKEELQEWCAKEGASLIIALLQKIAQGVPLMRRAQSVFDVVSCIKITKSHGAIDWSQPAKMIARQIIAFQKWPHSFTTLRKKQLIIHAGCVYNHNVNKQTNQWGTVVALDPVHGVCVQTGRGILAISRMQMQQRPISEWRQFVNGYALSVGDILGAGCA